MYIDACMECDLVFGMKSNRLNIRVLDEDWIINRVWECEYEGDQSTHELKRINN